MKRNITISITTHDQEYRLISEAAGRMNLPITTFVRWVLLAVLEGKKPVMPFDKSKSPATYEVVAKPDPGQQIPVGQSK